MFASSVLYSCGTVDNALPLSTFAGACGRLGQRHVGAHRSDALAFANKEVANAKAHLDDVNTQLRAMRDQEKTLDPRKNAEVTMQLAAKLAGQISAVRRHVGGV